MKRIITAVLAAAAAQYQQSRYYYAGIELLLPFIISTAALLSFSWCICVYVGASNRFSVLTAIAEDLGPYYSRAEKEIAETDMKN